MTINLAKGHFNVVDGHDVLKVELKDYELPSRKYALRIEDYLKGLPDINEAYETCLAARMGNDEIIGLLIKMYFPLKFFRVGSYEKMALVLGYIGMRGSCKTSSAVIVVSCDFLLRGLPVWSNVPINIRVCYRDAEKTFSSMPLQQLDMLDLTQGYAGGCILYDEVNMEAAEATRYSSTANLRFANVMQQIRKRQLSLVWTCQGWNWIDNRLRWQTDFVMACRDAILEKKILGISGIGDKSVWRVHDLSGTSGRFNYDYDLKHRYISDYLISTNLIWVRPWWHAYNTYQLEGQEDYIQSFREAQALKAQEAADHLPGPVGEIPKHTNSLARAVDEAIAVSEGNPISCRDFWQYINTEDRSIQVRAGRLFLDRGYIRAGDGHAGYYWIKKEVKENGTAAAER